LIGIIGLGDRIRDEVPDAIRTCMNAGIKVRMLTGDNKITATAIAKECKLINEKQEKYSVLTGDEFEELVGGLVCINCNSSIPCECSSKHVKERVRNLPMFQTIRS